MDADNTAKHEWGKNLEDWAQIQEAQSNPGYEHILKLLPCPPALKLLDIGCGAGGFCKLAWMQHHIVTGIDISPQFITAARHNIPGGIFITAEMTLLPFDNESFDVVCGFNSFQYTDHLDAALREAKRVLTPEGQLIILIWGNIETCEIATFLKTVSRLLPAAPVEGRNPFSLSGNDTLSKALSEVGFSQQQSEITALSWRYPDTATAVKGLLSLGALSHMIAANGVDSVREVVLQSLVPYTQVTGEVVFKNHYQVIISKI